MGSKNSNPFVHAALMLLACGAAAPAAETAAVDPLGTKQQTVQDRLKRLEDRLFRTREALSDREPENVERIEQAIQRLGELGVQSDVEAILAMLSRDQFDQAGAKQTEVLDDLRVVLKLLTETKPDPDKQQEEMERLEAIREELNKIAQEQREQRLASKLANPDPQWKEGLNRAIEAGQQLIADQLEQAGQTKNAQAGQANASPREWSNDQDKLKKDAEALTDQLEELEHAESPQAGHDEKNPVHQAHEETAKAAEAMNQAKESLDEADLPAAHEQQKEAVEKLQRAVERLKALAKEAEKTPDFKKMSEQQQETAEKTDALAKRMAADPKSPSKGDSNDKDSQEKGDSQEQGEGRESEGGEPQEQDNKPQPPKPLTPGQQNVAKAAERMQQAKKELDKDKAAEAGEQQDKALEQLDQAMNELEEELAQKRDEQQEQVLQDLEERFSKMLDAQKAINQDTLALHKVGSDNFKREEELKLGALAKQQKDVGNSAMRTLKILDADGSTIVFPRVVRQMGEDMFDVSDRIAGANVALATQQVQESIVTTLKELLGAIEQQQSEQAEGGGPGGAGGGGGAAPLLPGSAELKMLRAMQVRVNLHTKQLDEMQAGGAANQATEKRAGVLGGRQDEIADMAREIHERQLRRGP